MGRTLNHILMGGFMGGQDTSDILQDYIRREVTHSGIIQLNDIVLFGTRINGVL